MKKDVFLENKYFNDLNPRTCGEDDACVKGQSYGPHARDFYVLHYVVSGKGKYYVGGNCYEVSKGEIFIIKPNEFTTYTADIENPWHYIWIGFDGDYANKINELNKYVIPFKSPIFFDLADAENFISTREEYLASKLFLIFSHIFETTTHTHYVEMVKNYINTSYMRKMSVDGIAENLNVNRRYLSRIFKKKTHLTIQEYIINKRLSESIKLFNTDLTLQEISALVGYENQFIFSKIFKKKLGISPKKYRESENDVFLPDL